MCGKAVGSQRASGIETKPAEPENRSAQKNKGHVVYPVSGMFVSAASAKENGEYKGADSGTDMYHIASCKVYRAKLCQNSSAAPDHMSQRIVYQHGPESHEEKHCFKFHAPYQRTCD